MKYVPSFSGSPVAERIRHHESQILVLQQRIQSLHPLLRERERVLRGYTNILRDHESKLRFLLSED